MALQVEGWEVLASGKVRDLYHPRGDPDAAVILMVASDRVSAYDHLLTPEVPGKGALLTEVTSWWQSVLRGVRHHGVAPGATEGLDVVPAAVAHRAVLVQRLDMLPVECVVRAHLAGAAWAEYRRTGSVGETPLPPGLQFGDALPEPLFTPSRKGAVGEHDEPVTHEQLLTELGPVAEHLRGKSLAVFDRARTVAAAHGLVLGDTKFEFGNDPATGELVLADELLTPDSSRYWRSGDWVSHHRTVTLDKQVIRSWLDQHWNGQGEPPPLPADLVELVRKRYTLLRDALVGGA